MSMPYDATTKDLLELSPEAWPKLVGLEAGKVEIVDADVSTVSGATDKVIRMHSPHDGLLSVDFQSGPDADAVRRMHMYNAILEHRFNLPVRSILVLLAPKADLALFTGTHERGWVGQSPEITVRYQVIRVWRLSPDVFLKGGVGLVPLAAISDVEKEELPGVVRQMRRRLTDSCNPTTLRRLWTSAYVLMGLRYEEGYIERMLSGVLDMEESVTYQAIIRKGVVVGREQGALVEAKKNLILAGASVIGDPDAKTRRKIESITDIAKLEDLISQIGQVDSWERLLGGKTHKRRRRSRNGG